MRLEIKSNSRVFLADLVVCVYDRANYGIYGSGVGGYYGYVTAHYLNVVESRLKSTVCGRNKAFGTDTYEYILILYAGNVENCGLAEIELAALNSTVEHVDRRSTKELCNEEICRIIINLLWLTCLLNNAKLHNYDDVGD